MSNTQSAEREPGTCMHCNVIMMMLAEITAALDVIFLKDATARLE